MSSDYRFKYEYTRRFGQGEHTWSAVGAKGAVHLHVTDYGQDHDTRYMPDRYSGGIEIHYRYPPEYMAKKAPDHDRCCLLNAPCWHDGSSLQASERWIPHWQEFQGAPDEHDRMFALLEVEMDSRFESEGAAMTVQEVLHHVKPKGQGT